MGEDQPRRRASASRKNCDPVSPQSGYQFQDATDLQATTAATRTNFSTQQCCSNIAIVVVITILCLFTTLYALTGQWRQPHSDLTDFLIGDSYNAEGEDTIGILLHPEDHVSRNPGIVNLHWTITSGFRAPDGVKKRVYLINGMFFISHQSIALSHISNMENVILGHVRVCFGCHACGISSLLAICTRHVRN
jgi:hypothetical protein